MANPSTFRSLVRLGMIFVMLLGFTTSTRAIAKAEKPNVLFIAVDDLNDWISCMGGHPQCKTPNIDRLAARGTLFTNAHCAAPACKPSRTALMTGRIPANTGVYLNGSTEGATINTVTTLNEYFMEQGYHVAGAGKIYHSSRFLQGDWHESASGFVPSPRPKPADRSGGTGNLVWGPVDADDADMNDTHVTNWVIERIKKKHDKPFFIACGIFRPHLPWFAPRKYFDQYPLGDIIVPKVKEDDLDDVPPTGKIMAWGGTSGSFPNAQSPYERSQHHFITKHNRWQAGVQAYMAAVAYVDNQIGRVLDALDKSGQADNTIIVFWTDHGWHLGEKLHWKKFTLWEESTRTPLMIVAPGVTKAGTRCEQTTSLMDIYPTLVDLCGLPPRDDLDGDSLRPWLSDPARQRPRPALTTHGYRNHALRSNRWRYIRYADGAEELYDHQADPMEWTNLAGDAKYDEVKADLAKWLPKTDAEPTKKIPRRKKPGQGKKQKKENDKGKAQKAKQGEGNK